MKIKNTPKTNTSKTITRQCVICGENISVTVFSDGSYKNGNYFGAMRINHSPFVKRAEYWECDKCYCLEDN